MTFGMASSLHLHVSMSYLTSTFTQTDTADVMSLREEICEIRLMKLDANEGISYSVVMALTLQLEASFLSNKTFF